MKIVIIGGGTAGWLAALMVKKVHPHHEVVLIESKVIGIIGAGEGSTGFLADIIRGSIFDYGCDETDFFKETGATPKLGIQHENWKEIGHSYIAPLDSSLHGAFVHPNDETDEALMTLVAAGIPAHVSTEGGRMISECKSGYRFVSETEVTPIGLNAYHFDGHKVGQYFKKIAGSSVTTIEGIVTSVAMSEDGSVEFLILNNTVEQSVYGDWFIDASGFSSLLSKKMEITKKSYSKYLPVNRAMPFFLPKEETIYPVTKSIALKHGWMWQIPANDRRGCGYVYDQNYCSDDEALSEVQENLNMEVTPIKYIDFQTGALSKLIHKNVLFIGLAAAFAEPLEATSIHSTIVQLKRFVFNYLQETKEKTMNFGMEKIYNNKMTLMYSDFVDFLSVHYASQRTDSDFWKKMSSKELLTDNARSLIEIQKNKIVTVSDLTVQFGFAGPSLYNFVLAGLGYIGVAEARRDLEKYEKVVSGANNLKNSFAQYNSVESMYIDNNQFIKRINEGSITIVHPNK